MDNIFNKNDSDRERIDKICKYIIRTKGAARVWKILKNPSVYAAYVSDEYGNVKEPPLCFDGASGKEIFVDYDPEGVYPPLDSEGNPLNLAGAQCEIPEQYVSFRNIVFDRLVESIKNKETVLENHGGLSNGRDIEKAVACAVDAFFLKTVKDLAVSDLYAACNYLVQTMQLLRYGVFDEEKQSVEKILEQETRSVEKIMEQESVGSFLGMSAAEKMEFLEFSDGYHYVPGYVKNVQGVSDEIIKLAINKKKTGAAPDGEVCKELAGKLADAVRAARDGLKTETDPVCNIRILSSMLDDEERYSREELEYCAGLSGKPSERVDEITTTVDNPAPPPSVPGAWSFSGFWG